MEGSKFTILGAARTGSHMLCSFLESHPEILCHDEVFNTDEVYFAREIGDDPFIGGKAERDADSLLEKLWVNKGNHTSVGFKMIYPKHDGPVLDRVLSEPAVKVIVLKRRNRVAACTSFLKASQTGSMGGLQWRTTG